MGQGQVRLRFVRYWHQLGAQLQISLEFYILNHKFKWNHFIYTIKVPTTVILSPTVTAAPLLVIYRPLVSEPESSLGQAFNEKPGITVTETEAGVVKKHRALRTTSPCSLLWREPMSHLSVPSSLSALLPSLSFFFSSQPAPGPVQAQYVLTPGPRVLCVSKES